MIRARSYMCVLALVCAAPLAAQEPVVFRTPQMTALRDFERSHGLLAAATAQEVAAARMRVGAVPSRGPVTLSVEMEEWQLSRPLSQTTSVMAAHEFVPKGVIGAANERANAAVALAEARLEGVLIQRAVGLDRHVAQAVLWRRVHGRLLQEDSLLERASVTLSARFSIGEARYVDVIRLRTERIRVQTEAADALARSRGSVLELKAALDNSSGQLVDDAIASIAALPVPSVPEISALLAIAPVVRITAAETQLARSELTTVRADMTRRWTAGVGLQRFDTESGFTIGPSLSGSVTLPSTQRSVRESAALAAVHDTLAASGRQLAVIAQLRGDVASTEARLEAAKDRFEGVDVRLLAAAREERESAIISYATGGMQLSELLDFERTLARAEIQRLQSYLEIIDAWAALWTAVAGVEQHEDR